MANARERFSTATFVVMNHESVELVQSDVQDYLDGLGASDILFSCSDTFVSVSFVLHGSHATESGTSSVQENLRHLVRGRYRAQEFLMTGEPS
jgi:hypothetical protein